MTVAATLRIAFALLIAAAMVFPAVADDDDSDLSPAQVKAVEKVIQDYLQAHPEVVIEAFRAFQEREEATKRKRQQDALFLKHDDLEDDPTSPVGGNPEGDVTVVEFFDYQCGYCKRAWQSARELLKSDGNIRYVFKEFPILGPASVSAARAALAAWKQGGAKYVAFHTRLMESRGGLPKKKMMDLAADAGLDVEQLQNDMDDPQIDATLRKNFVLAKALDISGTPAFVLGDHLIPGAVDLDTLKSLIAAARKN